MSGHKKRSTVTTQETPKQTHNFHHDDDAISYEDYIEYLRGNYVEKEQEDDTVYYEDLIKQPKAENQEKEEKEKTSEEENEGQRHDKDPVDSEKQALIENTSLHRESGNELIEYNDKSTSEAEVAAAGLAGMIGIALVEPTPIGELAAGLYATFLMIKYGPEVVDLTADMVSEFAHKRKKQSTGKSGKGRHEAQYKNKKRPKNPNQRKGAEKRRTKGQTYD